MNNDPFRKSRLIVASLLLLILHGAAAGAEHLCNVRDFGAKGDKTANDSAAIQKAIDAAAKTEGGVVLLPKGDYLAGEINLASRVTLRLEEGATLYASTDAKDYHGGGHSGTLLNARGLDGILISVENVTVQMSATDFQAWPRSAVMGFHVHGGGIRAVARTPAEEAPPVVQLQECDGVTVEGR